MERLSICRPPAIGFIFFYFFQREKSGYPEPFCFDHSIESEKKSEISKFLSNFFFFMLFNGESIEQDVSGFFFYLLLIEIFSEL